MLVPLILKHGLFKVNYNFAGLKHSSNIEHNFISRT